MMRSDIDAFLKELKSTAAARGRLIFTLDATASRQPTWEAACMLQAEMFHEVEKVGGLDVQLIFYRGISECRASRWVSQAKELAVLMGKIGCVGGHTQIRKVLAHVKKEVGIAKVSALAFVGDAMEENPDDLCQAASELGALNVPAFMFQEGKNDDVTHTFREIARLTKGAHVNFNADAARQLAQLLRAVAAFATGGIAALEHRRDEGAIRLLGQLRRNS
jgi:hypothetical protein